MREIKFRAFIKNGLLDVEPDLVSKEIKEQIEKTGRYSFIEEPDLIDFKNNRILMDKHDWYDEEEFELMQYIGMKDKNGEEIYEGDIVEAWSEGLKARGEIKRRMDGLWLIYPAWQNRMTWSLATS